MNIAVRQSLRQSLRHSSWRGVILLLVCCPLWTVGALNDLTQPNRPVQPLGLITLDPGHFHAALFQKEMLPGVAETVHVYAPLGPDLIAHLDRIRQFNSRAVNPTRWKLEIHTGPNFLERLLAERPGTVVVLSGNNRGKIDRIASLVGQSLHVLADKPWIIEPEDFPKLRSALESAERAGVVAYDAMTQRFEISCILQKELVKDLELFGQVLQGSADQPAVVMESVHYLLKEVAGVPSRRPAWFFDIRQQGEALTDVGTHLVDLVQWTLFPEQPIDYEKDIRIVAAQRWPTPIGPEQFLRVTGEEPFPAYLKPALQSGGQLRAGTSAGHPASSAGNTSSLDYFANNSILYTIRGIHVRLSARWEFAPPPGGKDTEKAIYCGSKSRVEVHQGEEEQFRPEVYVIPNPASDSNVVASALRNRVALLQSRYPGLAIQPQSGRFHLVIPDRYRIGHEEHFGLLSRQFLGYVRHPESLPSWEKPNMLAKYYVTTKGVELARSQRSPSSTVKPEK